MSTPNSRQTGQASAEAAAPAAGIQLLVKYISRTDGGRPLRTILLTGTAAGVGTTTVACELVWHLAARLGQKTLLVDANYQTPTVHERNHLPLTPGLCEYLAGNAAGTVHEVEKLPLSLMTCGDRALLNRTVFSPDCGCKGLLETLAKDYVAVIIDAAPAVHSPETFNLASCVDGVVVVARSERSRREVVRATRERIELAGGAIVGGVLNRRRYHIPEWLYARMG